MKTIFAGTTEFGIPTLEKIKDSLAVVVTQPDRKSGRKQELTPPPIKVWAEKNGIPVLQPEKISEVKNLLLGYEADVMIVASYGQIIPVDVLDLPKHGSINIHPSLLPKYRGPTPIQTAILNGDKETGVTLIKMDAKLDHGPIIVTDRLAIKENEDFKTLHDRLAALSAELTARALPLYLDGKLKPNIQNEGIVTFSKIHSKNDARIKWTMPAKEIHQMVLALNPEPGPWTILDGKSVKILKTEILFDNKIELAGKVYRVGSDIAVKCADYSLKLLEIQTEGKKPISGQEFSNGLKNLETKIFV